MRHARTQVPRSTADQETRRVRAFISYAKEETAFVEQLRKELAALDVEALGDWMNTAGGEFPEQLKKSILRSDIVFLVLSPEAASSSICAWETMLAMATNKRVQPILCRNVDFEPFTGVELPEWANERNDDPRCEMKDVRSAVKLSHWVSMLTDSERANAREILAKVVHSDVEEVQFHTDLLVAAELAQHQRGMHLRGAALSRAELWLAATKSRPPDIYPQPTDGQRNYVETSRGIVSRRKWTVFLSLALSAIAVAAGFAYLRDGFRRRESDQNAQTYSRELGLRALKFVIADRINARAMAARAATERDTPEALDALRQTLLVEAAYRPARHGVSRVAFAVNENHLVTIDDDPLTGQETLSMWRPCDRKDPVPLGREALIVNSSKVFTAISVYASTGLIATASRGGPIRLWQEASMFDDCETSVPVGQFRKARILTSDNNRRGTLKDDPEINALAFSSDGELIAGCNEEGGCDVWNLREDAILRSFHPSQARVSSLRFSHSADWLALLTDPRSGPNEALLLPVRSNAPTDTT